ncbi:aminopeptidase P family protein [Clostridium sp. MSJ-8]|uniref:aminopeptidase P family protein n=1 Tax=Clostridium sp. MSJ-8 TaxID=2841510 RepID=UPI001C0EF15A|nr:aminopeptidase P family protein [Clostridium sp. MSJ-8]MBU5488997.1 aminopeptidase P family protein [Clostridium sp. MSJ-8]
MNQNFFRENRHRLIDKVEDNSIIILIAGRAPLKSADENYQFTPNRNFYYFTGIAEEEHLLVISKINNNLQEKLFIKEIDEERERWVGKSIRPDEAREVSGIEEISFKNELDSYLHRIIKKVPSINIYLDLNKEDLEGSDTAAEKFAEEISCKYKTVIIKNIFPKIIPLRLVKTSEEVEEIRKAIDITIKGVENIMKNAKPKMKEYQLEAYFEFACRNEGIKDYAFKTIAAAGKNATVLHYVDNNSEVKDNELVLFDLGAQWNYYNADITRTIPVNGTFTDRQKEVYNAVLRVNQKVIDTIKPGVVYKELNKQARKWIAEECIKLGLIKDEEEVSKYYWHSIGHSLGLDTHDVDTVDRETVFEKGMVWTVEPGIYIEEEGIGVRIEDDILVVDGGVEVLTKNMIKTVDEIEEFMKERK